MSKRRPGSELNHENWDKEEEAEDPGEFQKASAEAVKERKIIRARRRFVQGAPSPPAAANPFASLSGFKITPSNKPFAGFNFQLASSSSDTGTPTNSTNVAEKQEAVAEAEVAQSSEANNVGAASTNLLNVEPEKFSFATGLPFNSSKKADTRVGTTTGSDSASGNEISTSSESASLPPSLEPDSTYEARSDNGPCDSKGADEESVDNDVTSEKSNTNTTDGAGPDINHCLQNEPDSTEK